MWMSFFPELLDMLEKQAKLFLSNLGEPHRGQRQGLYFFGAAEWDGGWTKDSGRPGWKLYFVTRASCGGGMILGEGMPRGRSMT